MTSPQPTDEQLKQALALLLPKKLVYEECESCLSEIAAGEQDFESRCPPLRKRINRAPVKDTELLQIVWEIEETLTDVESEQYMNLLENNMDTLHGYPNRWRLTHATWKQRTIALAAVKGIKL